MPIRDALRRVVVLYEGRLRISTVTIKQPSSHPESSYSSCGGRMDIEGEIGRVVNKAVIRAAHKLKKEKKIQAVNHFRIISQKERV